MPQTFVALEDLFSEEKCHIAYKRRIRSANIFGKEKAASKLGE